MPVDRPERGKAELRCALLLCVVSTAALALCGGTGFSKSAGHRHAGHDCSAEAPRALIVGDVHGCARELQELLRRASLRPCDRIYFTGDLVGKGPDSRAVVEVVMALSKRQAAGRVVAVIGNWEDGLLRSLDGTARRPPKRLQRQLADALGQTALAWLRARPLHATLPPEFGAVVVVHAGLVAGLPLRSQPREHLLTMRSITPEGRPSSSPDGQAWAATWRGPPHVVFGHDARRKLQRHPNATGLDSGVVYGGSLSALSVARAEQRGVGIGPTRLLQVAAQDGSCARTSSHEPVRIGS